LGAAVETFSLKTHHREELVDITGRVNEIVERLGIAEGMCWVSVPHTTAAVTVNEGYDPDVAADISAALARIVPRSAGYRHAEGNSDAHVKATLVGSCQPVPVENGRLALGQWQAVFFCEFDGPRTREVRVKVIAG
jgi:secondary thiamine-phosphate synthase enzyme